ncbi:hypothetical protein BT93_L5589 [Corymbia citriodora subsp. variegata]|uniref:Yos1-like protein n=1 Tax=Corymbia citriodora subsp. variegata TaxID=360336 RepID=A0A8T0CJ75_CORYI|nr:hypothetical protein BT93_L5589 [Corymbia citriodora subsp. variegata]
MLFLFPLGNLIYITVLLLNAVAVLSEDRFLARIGWGRASPQSSTGFNTYGGQNEQDSVKSRIVNLISSIRMVTRVPLIAVNLGVIVYEILLG